MLMNNTNLYFLILLLFVFIKPLSAQDHNEHNEGSDHEKIHHHSLGPKHVRLNRAQSFR